MKLKNLIVWEGFALRCNGDVGLSTLTFIVNLLHVQLPLMISYYKYMLMLLPNDKTLIKAQKQSKAACVAKPGKVYSPIQSKHIILGCQYLIIDNK